jgi:hypothetical protein
MQGVISRTAIVFLSAFLILATGCKQLDLTPELPAETQEGKHTFGCKVDDAFWLPYAEHTLDRAIEPDYDSGYFSVRVEREIGDVSHIYLQLGDSTGLHTKTYSKAEGFSASVNKKEDGVYDTYFTSSSSEEANITLTKAEMPAADGSKQVIVSGRFSFVATSATTGKSIRVTDGRFDLKVR